MKYICCQPAIDYYTWQVEAMLKNFVEVGIPEADIHIVCAHYGSIPEAWKLLSSKYAVNFHFYKDTRGEYPYIPSIYFHLMKKFLTEFPDMQQEVLFLHDCDILFTKPVDFKAFEEDDIFYLSNTNSYINYDYVSSKGLVQFLDMCNVIGIDPEIVRNNNEHSGGGQYICKNLTPELFEKTEKDSVKLYDLLCRNESAFRPRFNNELPIQKWTAGMWAFLWNIWLAGHKTIVHKDLDFCMATDSYEKITEVSIYHNAGVNDTLKNTHFFKGAYMTSSPVNTNLTLSNNASKWYYEQIKKLLV